QDTAEFPAIALPKRDGLAITVVSGAGQQATVGTALAPLVVEVRDSSGNLVPNVPVTFAQVAPSGDADAPAAIAATTAEATGRASAAPVLGTTAGAKTFRASLDAEAGGASVDLVVTALAETTITTATLAPAGGDGQTEPVGRVLPAALAVIVRDRHQNPIPGVQVDFAAELGSVSSASRTTDANGRAWVVATLSTTAGQHLYTA